MRSSRPITLLIAALGGEGGGVLTDWIVSAAAHAGYPVQSTSIPGVAQRTGATTYYIEILPVQASELGGKRPVLALTPGVGDIDVVVASELMEAGRAVANGFVTPDRTHVIASTQPLLCDGREDRDGRRPLRPGPADQGDQGHARDALLFDMAALAKQSGAIINAVMLGAIAGSGRLPIKPETVRGGDPRRRQGGRRQPARLPRRARGGARERLRPQSRPTKRDALGNAGHGRARSARTFPAARRRSCSKACAASFTIKASPTRGSISTGCGRSSKPTRAPARRENSSRKPRGISRCACRSRT